MWYDNCIFINRTICCNNKRSSCEKADESTSADFLIGIAGAFVGNIIFHSVMVMAEADNNSATDNLGRYIPYDGYLELDGEPLSASDLNVRFTLYDDTDTSLWNEELTVNVYNGKFAVLLGQTSDITDSVFDSEDLISGAISATGNISTVPFIFG